MLVDKDSMSEIIEIAEIIKALNEGTIKESNFNFNLDASASPEMSALNTQVKRLLQNYSLMKKSMELMAGDNFNFELPNSNNFFSPLALLKDKMENSADQINLNNGKKLLENFENTQLLFYRLNPNGIITHMGKLISKCTGFLAEELIGEPLEKLLFNPKDKTELWNQLFEKKELKDYELILKNKEDREIYVSINAFLKFDGKNEPFEIEGSMFDITERKTNEEARERLLEELEVSRQQIEEEAVELIRLNTQLEQSEEKLQELNDSKDKFFSIIGHDLKNPFQAITKLSEILKDDFSELDDEEKIQFIEMIIEASQSAYQLLENLLTWSRSQTGRIDFVLETVQLNLIASNVVQLLLPQAESKQIVLSSNITPELAVKADKNMLNTILRNLTSNAIKFTNPGGMVNIIAMEQEDYIQLSVEDSGIGLTEEDMQKLFKVGIKNSEIGRSKEKGTGLGLILCKEFVEKHGGKIWVESEFNKGTKIKFTIPKAV
jgi:PAS domain S-box-containing protein